MKKILFFAAAAMLAACNNDSSEIIETEYSNVTLTFSPYDVEPLTRTATSIADVVSHLDVWLVEGGNVTDLHQSNGDAGFGTINVTLDKTKTYTLYAVAHKCTDDATLVDGVISFPDDKVTHSMFYTTTFTPANTTSLSCLMQRIVAAFRVETSDAVPAACKKVRFTTVGVFDRWNVTTGAAHALDRVNVVNITSTAQDGTVAITIYNIVTAEQTTHTITVEALDADDAMLQTRTFSDVPLRNGYKTTYRGSFFTDAPVTTSFIVEDWNTYDVVAF